MRLLEIIWWLSVGAIVSGAVVGAIAVRKYHKLFEFAVSRTQQMRKYRDELMLLKQTEIRVLEPTEEERAESRNREYERDEFLKEAMKHAKANWGEDERAEYELGVHLEQKRMGDEDES